MCVIGRDAAKHTETQTLGSTARSYSAHALVCFSVAVIKHADPKQLGGVLFPLPGYSPSSRKAKAGTPGREPGARSLEPGTWENDATGLLPGRAHLLRIGPATVGLVLLHNYQKSKCFTAASTDQSAGGSPSVKVPSSQLCQSDSPDSPPQSTLSEVLNLRHFGLR